MNFPTNLEEGRFLRRLNRFTALVQLGQREVLVHVANSGRLRELLQPENRCLLAPVHQCISGKRTRRTAFDLVLVDLGHTLVSADARLPNALVEESLLSATSNRGRGSSSSSKDLFPQFRAYEKVEKEVRFGDSRLDLRLSGPEGTCLVEVKSVTLLENGIGLFPDAPTERGCRHLLTLKEAVKARQRAAVVFVVQRHDAVAFAPHDAADPRFGETLREAVRSGVEAYAYRCRVTPREIRLSSSLPVRLA